MAYHYPLGASGMYRWSNCPASLRLSEGIPREASEWAAEGTAAHTLAERCLRDFLISGLPIRAEAHIGLVIEADGYTFEVDEEMAENVQVYLDAVYAIMAEYPGAELHIEKQFHLKAIHNHIGGTADAVIVIPFLRVVVIDLKYGKGYPVEIRYLDGSLNGQLAIYGLGVAYGEDYGDVDLVIVQPRARHADGPIRWTSVTLAELERWGQEVLLPAAKATEDPEAKPVAGEWCKFCAAKAICPAMRAVACEMAGLKPAPDFFPVEAKPVLPDPMAMHAEDLGRAKQLGALVTPWIEAVNDRVRALLMGGTPVPGFKLVAGKAARVWLDEEKATDFLETWFPDGEAYEKKLLSPAKAEKAFKEKGYKGLTPFELDGILGKKDAAPVVAPEYDKRPAVTPAALAFAPINPENELDL